MCAVTGILLRLYLQAEGTNFGQLINFDKMECEIGQVSLPPEIDVQTAKLLKYPSRRIQNTKRASEGAGSFNETGQYG